MTLDDLNQLSSVEAQSEFFKCCGSKAWSLKMAGLRPFKNLAQVKQLADKVWNEISVSEKSEAFLHHPRIGERTQKKWESDEQSGTQGADAQVLTELSILNREYEAKFGRVYLICATGKSAAEMLSILKERIHNAPEVELKVALNEQAKITQLRLEKLLK